MTAAVAATTLAILHYVLTVPTDRPIQMAIDRHRQPFRPCITELYVLPASGVWYYVLYAKVVRVSRNPARTE